MTNQTTVKHLGDVGVSVAAVATSASYWSQLATSASYWAQIAVPILTALTLVCTLAWWIVRFWDRFRGDDPVSTRSQED